VALALPADTPARLAAVAEGAVLGAYAFTAQKSERARAEADTSRPVRELEVVTPLAAADADPVLRRAAVVGDAVCAVRDLVNTAPSHLYPA
ncbi:hypothetical protein M3M33_14270, partial [Loigolactobacillus coryniformis]